MPRDPDLLPVVHGEDRPTVGGLGFTSHDDPVTGSTRRKTGSSPSVFGSDDDLQLTEAHAPPSDANENYRKYFIEFDLAQAALSIFEDQVIEPGWRVEATDSDGDVDEQMTDALQFWGSHCAIRAGERGKDIRNIIEQIPSGRRAKPAKFVEIGGTKDDPSALAALQFLDPATMEIFTHRNQNLIVYPNDSVGPGHPRVNRYNPEADPVPAGYVQYSGTSSTTQSSGYINRMSGPNAGESAGAIPFPADRVMKFVHKPPEGSPWGRTLWPAIDDKIEGLIQKINDRNAAIRLTGWPHRMYIGENWDKNFARKLAAQHDKGEVTAQDSGPGREEPGQKHSNAGRNDFLPGNEGDVNIETIDGSVPDISSAVTDDVEGIFSVLPMSKPMVAYSQDINQYVIDPLERRDDQYVDGERYYLRQKFEPLFERKADELASGEAYEGEVTWEIGQPEADHPLERSEYDVEGVADLVGAFADYARADADAVFGSDLPFTIAQMEREEFAEVADVLADLVGEEGESATEAAEEMGLPESETGDGD